MSNGSKDHRTRAQLLEEIEALRWRLEEAEQTIEAIRHGDVDALVVTSPRGEQVFSISGAEHIYRVIVETMNEAAVTVDPDGTVLFCDLMKTPIQEVIGRKVTAFAARPQQFSLQAMLKDARAAAVQRRVTLRATDGTAVPVQLSASPLQIDGVISICLVASDLTELEASANSIHVLREHRQALEESESRFRAQAEELVRANAELQESEEKYRTLFTSIDEGFCIIEMVFDADGKPADYRFLEVNPAFEKQTGLHEAQGRLMRELAPDHEAHWFEIYGRIALTGEPARFVNEAKALNRWYNVYAFRVGGRESRKVAILFDDITERRRTEEALRELNATLENKVAQRTGELEYRAKQLQRLTLEVSEAEDRERQRLAEILHDDLQQILAAAKFHLNLIRNRVKYDPSLQATAAQINHMLKDAIDKSRGLSHELSPAVLHHGDFTDTLVWLAGQIQTKHGLLVRVDTFSKVEVQSDALKTFLYKAAQELLFNVVKHARINEARVRVRRWGRCVCLSVSDRGRGFDPRELRQTAGFGLFSIRERVELLGGRMKIRSVKGGGSKFHIVVPDGEPSEEGITPGQLPTGIARETEPVHGTEERRLRVLLADDHEIVREGLICLLNDEHSIQVVGEAANGPRGGGSGRPAPPGRGHYGRGHAPDRR